MLSPEELDAILGRADGATKPPWSHWPQTSLSTRPRETVMAKTGPGLGCMVGEEITEPDATFIAHARTDVPALLAMVEELKAKLAIEVSELTIENSVRMQAEDEAIVAGRCARAAEAKLRDGHSLMAQGWSKARKAEGEATSRWAELYRCQCILDGTPTKYPHMTAGPEPVDDVSSLLIERLKRDADRIGELEAAQRPRPMADAPRDGEFWAIVPLTYCAYAAEEFGQPSYKDRDGDLWSSPTIGDMWLGWLPLPDQTEVNP